MLKSQDIVVLCWLALHGGRPWRYLDASQALGISVSECHAAVARLKQGRLLSGEGKPVFSHVRELFQHGFRFVFFPEYGSVGRGVPTGVAGPALAPEFSRPAEVPVWPHAYGEVRGYELKPLHRKVPEAARSDAGLHALLSLLDALREGGARERKIAAEKLDVLLRELEEHHGSGRSEPGDDGAGRAGT